MSATGRPRDRAAGGCRRSSPLATAGGLGAHAGGCAAAARGLPARAAGHAAVLAAARARSSWPPCACFLLLAVSPRLFSQGNAVVHADLPAPGAHRRHRGRDRQLAVGQHRPRPCSGSRSASRSPGWPRAPRCPAAGCVPGAMWLVLLLPSWLPGARLGADRPAGRRDVPARAGLAVGHPPDHGPVRRGAAARPALRPVQLPGHHRRPGRPRAGVRGRRPGARREPARRRCG